MAPMANTEIASQDDVVWFSGRSRFRTAMLLAVVVDCLQIILFPLFSEGALSPAEDFLDVAIALILSRLIGWHWEFLPSFLTELVPGADMVPFWTLAVANVYRKWKKNLQIADSVQNTR